MRDGHSTYESDVVFDPLSMIPWCMGPSLYIWLLWFDPLPAFMNEKIPAISSVDLWWVTVKGPANMEHASPWYPPQLAKKSEFSAEYCFERVHPCPMKHLSITAASLTFDPEQMIK